MVLSGRKRELLPRESPREGLAATFAPGEITVPTRERAAILSPGRADNASDTRRQEARSVRPLAETRPDDPHSFLSHLTRSHLLTAEQERGLAMRIARGDKHAKDRLVESNLRLVVAVAKIYRACGIPFEDLVQEGTIGLMIAAERFDYKRGYRFSTYATQWIRQAISRAVDNKSKSIRIPAHITESLRKVERARFDLLRENGEEPSNEQIAAHIGYPVRKVIALLTTTQEPISLDMPVGEEETGNIGALITDKTAPDPEDALLGSEMRSELATMLSVLDERELIVMRKRYGFDGEETQILQQIGEELNLSRERVRQIEAQALRKLRSHARKRQLREYLAL